MTRVKAIVFSICATLLSTSAYALTCPVEDAGFVFVGDFGALAENHGGLVGTPGIDYCPEQLLPPAILNTLKKLEGDLGTQHSTNAWGEMMQHAEWHDYSNASGSETLKGVDLRTSKNRPQDLMVQFSYNEDSSSGAASGTAGYVFSYLGMGADTLDNSIENGGGVGNGNEPIFPTQDWVGENFDSEDQLKQSLTRELNAYLNQTAEGFDVAAQVGAVIYDHQSAKFTLLVSRGREGLYEAYEEAARLFDWPDEYHTILERAQPLLDAADEEVREAVSEREYYQAPIGSDERPTNLPYGMADEGFRYERQLEDSTYEDPNTGEIHETDRYQLPAENRPDLQVDAESSG